MMTWKPNWPQSRQHYIDWWNRKGLVFSMSAPADKPVEEIPAPPKNDDVEKRWIDPKVRGDIAERGLSRRYYASDAFPYLDSQIGPGSLGTFLGSKPNFAPDTVWYDPCISDPDNSGPLKFDPDGHWFKVHMAVIDEGLRRARGRFLVGIPDLIENIDTLASLRGTEEVLFDLLERPAWVHARLEEINQAYFQAFDLMYQKVKDQDGGNAFSAFGVWGPGRTAKVQADFSAMISPQMFNEYVKPHLTAQCQWLDYSMYHLDGTNALQHLDALLSIEPLDAIEWTPQAGLEEGGHPRWYDLYKQIKAAGKSIQVIQVKPEQVQPLLDAVGPAGTFILSSAPDQKTVDQLIKVVDKYR